MCRLTFEQAMKETLANSRLCRIMEGDEFALEWQIAYVEDRTAIENLIDKLCEDLSKIIDRRVSRKSFISRELMMHGHMTLDEKIESAFVQLNRSIKNFIKRVFENIGSAPEDSPIFFPISKIRWCKEGAKIDLPDSFGMIEHINLLDPTKRSCVGENDLSISKILKVCETTHFDYQPFILEDKNNKILALKVGNDWHDLAISNFQINFGSIPEFYGAVLCFFILLSGSWWATKFESEWISIPLLAFSIAIGIIGGIFTTMFIAKKYKPLRL